jgi:hypothetical protein
LSAVHAVSDDLDGCSFVEVCFVDGSGGGEREGERGEGECEVAEEHGEIRWRRWRKSSNEDTPLRYISHLAILNELSLSCLAAPDTACQADDISHAKSTMSSTYERTALAANPIYALISVHHWNCREACSGT